MQLHVISLSHGHIANVTLCACPIIFSLTAALRQIACIIFHGITSACTCLVLAASFSVLKYSIIQDIIALWFSCSFIRLLFNPSSRVISSCDTYSKSSLSGSYPALSGSGAYTSSLRLLCGKSARHMGNVSGSSGLYMSFSQRRSVLLISLLSLSLGLNVKRLRLL